MQLVPIDVNAFVWVTGFPDVRARPGLRALAAVHHPFTAPNPADLDLLDGEPWKARAQAYDLVLNGTELGGGSIRINDPRVQSRIFRLLGIDEATAQARFGFLLEALRAGAPPHGGIAFGFDRITMVLAGATSLRDVIAFPKTDGGPRAVRGCTEPRAGAGHRGAAHQTGVGAGCERRFDHPEAVHRGSGHAHPRRRQTTAISSSCPGSAG
jgi:aspartyl-tRNA synthetase